jgi:hypothetical protein
MIGLEVLGFHRLDLSRNRIRNADSRGKKNKKPVGGGKITMFWDCIDLFPVARFYDLLIFIPLFF